MTRQELLSIAKPILFNTEMVNAILEGRKTVTRRCVKYKYSNTEMKMHTDKYGTRLIEIQKNVQGETHGRYPDGRAWQKLLPYIEKNPPFKKGNYLYVRETWNWYPIENDTKKSYIYRADFSDRQAEYGTWKPSLHMPKKAARIFLKVADVRVERLQDITDVGAEKEGATPDNPFDFSPDKWPNLESFKIIWDSTIKKQDLNKYGWEANPWVWVIEFEKEEV